MTFQAKDMDQQFNLWISNQYHSFKVYPICKMSILLGELVNKGLFQFIIHEPLNEQEFNSFSNACTLNPFTVNATNCFKLFDISKYLQIPALSKFINDYIIAKNIIRPTTYYSSTEFYEFIIHIKLIDIQPIQHIEVTFFMNDWQKSVIIITPQSKPSNLPQKIVFVSKDFNSDIVNIGIESFSKQSMQIRLIDHKIGETFVYNDYYDTQNKQSPKIHFEMDFIPHLRQSTSDDIIPIEKNEKEILQLKTQQKQELDQKNKEIQQLKRELELKNKEIQKMKKDLDQKRKDVIESPEKSSLNTIKLNIYDHQSYKKFEKIEEIDSGGSSTVYKVAMKVFYALKEMKIKNKTADDFKRFLGEYEIMNLLNHPNILKTYGFYFGGESNAPSIILEYCPRNLNSAIKNKSFSSKEIICCIFQIIEGMKYIHFRKIIHRDLKPSNILIAEDGTIKIGDFGVSKLMSIEEQSSMTSGIGTQKYMAPEILNEEKNYTEKVDVYSFGVLLYFILNKGDITNIKIGDVFKGKKVECPNSFTAFAKELIGLCLSFDSKTRPGFTQICELLEKNKYALINLAKLELNQIQSFVKSHKEKIPRY